MVDPGTARAEFHYHPRPHFVMSESTWRFLKEHIGAPESSMPGVIGHFTGEEVYLDRCPWDSCASTPWPVTSMCISCGQRPAHPQGAFCDPCLRWMRRPWWQWWKRRP